MIPLSVNALVEALISLGRKKDVFCDLYIQSSFGHSISVEDGRTEEITSGSAGGSGFRLLSDGMTHYGHVHGITSDVAVKLVDDVIKTININCPLPMPAPEPLVKQEQLTNAQIDSAMLREIHHNLVKESKYIKKVTLRLSTSEKEITIINSRGDLVRDTRYSSRFSAHIVVEKDGKLFSGYESRGFSLPFAKFLERTDTMSTALKAAKRALLGPECSPCPAGKVPVVLSGEAGGTMIHEACGHALEGDIVYKNRSVFKDRIGEVVANPAVTLIDDATIEGAFGSYKFDDEGTPAQRTILIEDGILKAYMADVFCNKMWGLPLTGNGRRESYTSYPITRMSNTFLLPGNMEKGEIISRVSFGLYAQKMGGGETDPTTGDFVFNVEEAYLIEEGKITVPVKGAILVGNGPQVLKDILAVGSDLELDVGFCGKNGQSVPVTDGQPTVLIKELVVGGSDI